ncbi:MAG: hypothetical protein WCJ55_20050 [Chloroflexales bacterium]
MRLTFGAALTLAMVAIPAYVVWRVTQGIEEWFATSGAGNLLMWSIIVALVLSVAALPVAAWGVAARMWIIRLHEDERAVASARVLLPSRPPDQIDTMARSHTLCDTER